MQASPPLADKSCKKQFPSFVDSFPLHLVTRLVLQHVLHLHIHFLSRYLTGMVDKRTLEKYEREAKEKNRETW